MKFRVTLKDPDGPEDAFTEAAESYSDGKGLTGEERELIEEKKIEELREFAGQWLEFGEYARIEFDTDAGTARLLKEGE